MLKYTRFVWAAAGVLRTRARLSAATRKEMRAIDGEEPPRQDGDTVPKGIELPRLGWCW